MGHRARGHQRRRRRVERVPARPRPLARLPLGRGRHRRLQRQRAAPVPVAGAVERHDPILKERIFGLTNDEGNHGEDVKEYWFYLDAHARPQLLPQDALQVPAGAPTPTSTCSRRTRRRGREQLEYELLDTGIFDEQRYFDVAGGVREGGSRRHPDARHGDESRARCGAPARAADAVVPQHLGAGESEADDSHGPRRSQPGAPGPLATHERHVGDWTLNADPTAGRCSATTRPTRSASPAPRPRLLPQGRASRDLVTRRADRQPGARGTKARCITTSSCSPARRHRRSACG